VKEHSLAVGDLVEVQTERLAYGGDAIARFEGLAIFIPLAAPDERLRVRITERKRNFARAIVEEVLAPSPSRREAPCRYFGLCGGCQLQHLTYRAQLEAKAAFVRDAVTRIGKLDWPHKIEVRGSLEFGYRARAQVKLESVESQSGEEIRIGFSRAASHSVCDVEECPILLPELNQALTSLRTVVKESKEIRERAFSGRRIGEVEFAAGDFGVSFDPATGSLPGGNISRVICGATYRFSPATFFQVNPILIEALVEEAVSGPGGSSALDLYAGVGLFTVQLARKFERVVGIESDERSSEFARRNLAANGLENVKIYTGRTERILSEVLQTGRSSRHDLILLDPPRSGAAEAINHIAALKPARISYVSCDPTTLARDLGELTKAGYELIRVTAFDLFPQTYHVETVAHLQSRML
jgi:23S rRNA (uracil1939-C5)-methyltransferase